MLGRNQGTKLQFPWHGPVLITKVLDRGRVVVRLKQDKPLTVLHVDRLEAYRGKGMQAWMVASSVNVWLFKGVEFGRVSRHFRGGKNPPPRRKADPPSPPEKGKAGLYRAAETGSMREAAPSGPDQAQKRARSTGHASHAAEKWNIKAD